MEYNEIPEELEDNEIVIYEDIDGKIEIDQYLRKEDAESLKAYLQSIGKQVYYNRDPQSFDVGRPFRNGKPFIQKRSIHEVDWSNEQVIVEALNPSDNSEIAVKRLVELSGRVSVADSKATGFTLDARYKSLDFAFRKWKRENSKTETTESRMDLCKEFAKHYIEEEKKKKQKRVQVGTEVLVYDTNKKGKVIEYLEEEGEYRIETEDGSSRYLRKGFEVI